MDGNITSARETDLEHQKEIVFLVVMEMTIGVVGIFLNLMVVSSVRSEDSLQESTRNLLLANICFSNLVVSFLVKPISAIYVSYALSTGEWRVGLAFCTLYTLSYRTTWLVYPFTILALCWHSVTGLFSCCRVGGQQQQGHGNSTTTINTKQGSTVRLELQESIEEDLEFVKAKKAMAFPTIRQKSLLFFIWIVSTLYGLAACFPDKLFGASQGPSLAPPTGLQSDLSFCPVRSAPGDVLDRITIYLSIYIPTILGPLLTLLLCVVSLPFAQCRQSSSSPSSCWSSALLPCLIFLHISNYYINLFLADSQESDFHFLLVKYGLGFSFIILSPLLIIATQDDIRVGVKKTFKGTVMCKIKENNDTKLSLGKSVDSAEKVVQV